VFVDVLKKPTTASDASQSRGVVDIQLKKHGHENSAVEKKKHPRI
jgi:hypothetical protein